ncbi:hypothetical protein [Flagellimonas baculiformis]|uniref:hypothetical protein n=1 Tax=Flagellimonas baculiformis TaxID=3067310 RepID=UPI00296E9E86|nr:hypothetical protein [Muricauda sp. D6]
MDGEEEPFLLPELCIYPIHHGFFYDFQCKTVGSYSQFITNTGQRNVEPYKNGTTFGAACARNNLSSGERMVVPKEMASKII